MITGPTSISNGLSIEIIEDDFFWPYLIKANTILFRRKCLGFHLLRERFTEVKDLFIYFMLLYSRREHEVKTFASTGDRKGSLPTGSRWEGRVRWREHIFTTSDRR
jgi:hypothetical protein